MAELESPTVMPRLIEFLSSLLQRVAESNDLNPAIQGQKMSVFHGLTRPTISIHSYLDRIFKYANCSPSCYIVAYVYLDRFTHRHPSLPINSFNVHRLLITSVMLSAKFMDDIFVLMIAAVALLLFIPPFHYLDYPNNPCLNLCGNKYYNNAYYAKVGGISTTEMNFLEVDFLFGLGFHLNVTPTTFHTYCSYLQSEMMLQPHLHIADDSSSLYTARTSKLLHLCFNEDESSHQQQQQQLAV